MNMLAFYKRADIPNLKQILGIQSPIELVHYSRPIVQRNGETKVIIGLPIAIEITSLKDTTFHGIDVKVNDTGYLFGIMTSGETMGNGGIRIKVFTISGGINQNGQFRPLPLLPDALNETKYRENAYRFFHDYSTCPDERGIRRLERWYLWTAGYNNPAIHRLSQANIGRLIDSVR
jgi:hypothetical protein